jgi:hypothetical protein
MGFGIISIALVVFGVEGFTSRRAIPAKPIPEQGEG